MPARGAIQRPSDAPTNTSVPLTAPRRLDPERDRQIGLPGSGWPEEDDVLGLGQEVELGEVGDERPVDGTRDREVEVVEGLRRREAGGLDRAVPPWLSRELTSSVRTAAR